MGQAPGQLADGLHPLGVGQLALHHQPLGDVVEHEQHAFVVDRFPGQYNPPFFSALGDDGCLEVAQRAVVLQTGDEVRAPGLVRPGSEFSRSLANGFLARVAQHGEPFVVDVQG